MIGSNGRALGAIALAGLLASCGSTRIDEATKDDYVKYAWVVMGDGGKPVARAATTYGTCPVITVDGTDTRMALRVAASTPAQRTTASAAADSKPSAFPLNVCETTVATDAKEAHVGSRALPLPKAAPQRIVILADTGCRMKKADNAWQSCNDADAWPLAQIAATDAKLQPDLVLHIGDYHYRENACPSDIAGCKDSPWGYGWDTWEADLFKPAAPLLAAAPWIVVRGNHEECARAGQGWFRLLAPERYDPRRSCNDPANDDDANYSPPYAVPLGAALQLLVFDSAHAGNTPLDPRKPGDVVARQRYADEARAVARYAARPGVRSWFASHHPVLGFAPRGGEQPPYGGNPALLQALGTVEGAGLFPPGVQFALHGHVHLLELLAFASGEPATLVAGNGGDNLDPQLPHAALAQFSPAPGVRIGQATHASRFGFVLLERQGEAPDVWRLTAFRVDGSVLTACRLGPGRMLHCDPAGGL